ncbi:hypothetical protein Pcac1_g7587 [Phytophthora cactorum]|uniref:Uncharacterized protein n=1 Tax=Phytophthora cactorum TaxID=29920 RepID=A0A8T1ECY5_9STRA|nr:hypothetical protein Pcac1_g7587 [Phytophthora cactorum]KAG2832594.1 hypothetical protein PC112_g6838 [Phytophthora cactorum]KAG2859495.1 hypothetical protein PC113_g8882 [Phytophthora cactorum]KAG2911629.1 hypothetical protein PC114_g9312 [Phytophthora cactorum]KAG2932305.1 hypothetical protein PC115_g5838 [Phytophthora cactorum]
MAQRWSGSGSRWMCCDASTGTKEIDFADAEVQDAYDDALFPGRVKNEKALNDWASFTGAMDRQIRWNNIPTFIPRLMLKHFGTA